VELIGNLPPSRLVKQKLVTMSDIVHSQLFLSADCRSILLPSILARIKELLASSEEVCVLYKNIYCILYLKIYASILQKINFFFLTYFFIYT
jgi:hypothetical protein